MALRSTPTAPPARDDPQQARVVTSSEPLATRESLDSLAPPPERAGHPAQLARLLPPLALGVAGLLLWQLIAQTGLISSLFLPAPAAVWRSFWAALLDWQQLPSEALVTLEESLGGFAIGVLIAVPVGYGIARSRLLARMLQPYIAASQAVPAVALAPLLVLWLPFGLPPVIALCALIIFFPMVVNTALGIRALDRDVVDAARVDGAGGWTLVRAIELPLALPSILAGVRTSLTLSITGAVVGEFVVSGVGLGGALVAAQANFNTPLVFATLLMLGLLAAALYGVARLVERRFSYLEA